MGHRARDWIVRRDLERPSWHAITERKARRASRPSPVMPARQRQCHMSDMTLWLRCLTRLCVRRRLISVALGGPPVIGPPAGSPRREPSRQIERLASPLKGSRGKPPGNGRHQAGPASPSRVRQSVRFPTHVRTRCRPMIVAPSVLGYPPVVDLLAGSPGSEPSGKIRWFGAHPSGSHSKPTGNGRLGGHSRRGGAKGGGYSSFIGII